MWLNDGTIQEVTLAPANRDPRATTAPARAPRGAARTTSILPPGHYGYIPLSTTEVSGKHLGSHGYVWELPGSY